MMRRFAALLLVLLCTPVWAQDLLMARSRQEFPEAMLTLQESIRAHGYDITRVQRVDIGLTGMGYETDKYRVVFYAKAEEIRRLTAANPELIAYFPPSISIFAENGQTLMVAADPRVFKRDVEDPQLRILFDRWASDLHSIFVDLRKAE